MTPKKEIPDCICGASDVLDLLSRKLAIQTLCAVALQEPARYQEIEDALADASSSTLSTRLQELTEAGLLHRQRYDEIPPRVEYSLTKEGKELYRRLEPLVDWLSESQVSVW